VRLHQDADLYATLVNGDEKVAFEPRPAASSMSTSCAAKRR
jgi:hypothetical protein